LKSPKNRNVKGMQKGKTSRARHSRDIFESKFNPKQLFAYGPVVTAYIEIPESMKLARKALGKPVPDPVLCRMLVDTGATRSYVTPSIALLADLPIIDDDIEIIGVGQTSRGKRHFARMTLKFKKITRGREIVKSVVVNSEVTSGALPKAPHIDGLIGRDVLSHFRFTYNGESGSVTFQYLK
jgi:hypothetical protein